MGYKNGRKWTEDQVKKELLNIVNVLGLKNFPTKSQMINFCGNRGLANAVSRTGGSRYYANLIGLQMVDCESELGNNFEEYAIDEIMSNTGFLSLHTNVRYPYDLLTNGNIKVDIKVSKRKKDSSSKFPYHSFNLEKREPTCDIFIFYCLDDNLEIEKRIIIPSCILSGKTQLGMGILSKWDAYIDKWEYFDKYNNFYESIKQSAIELPRRRTKQGVINEERNND